MQIKSLPELQEENRLLKEAVNRLQSNQNSNILFHFSGRGKPTAEVFDTLKSIISTNQVRLGAQNVIYRDQREWRVIGRLTSAGSA